jgi:hypothetical protein
MIVAAGWRPLRAGAEVTRDGGRPTFASAGVAVLVVVDLLVSADVLTTRQRVRPFPRDALAASIAGSRCVMSDSPMPLIQLDVLSSDFAHGCANWVDVSARTYGVDHEAWGGKHLARSHNPRWQRDLQRYLLSGDTVILFRAHVTGIGAQLRTLLRSMPVLGRSGRIAVLKTGSAAARRYETRTRQSAGCPGRPGAQSRAQCGRRRRRRRRDSAHACRHGL